MCKYHCKRHCLNLGVVNYLGFNWRVYCPGVNGCMNCCLFIFMTGEWDMIYRCLGYEEKESNCCSFFFWVLLQYLVRFSHCVKKGYISCTAHLNENIMCATLCSYYTCENITLHYVVVIYIHCTLYMYVNNAIYIVVAKGHWMEIQHSTFWSLANVEGLQNHDIIQVKYNLPKGEWCWRWWFFSKICFNLETRLRLLQ